MDGHEVTLDKQTRVVGHGRWRLGAISVLVVACLFGAGLIDASLARPADAALDWTIPKAVFPDRTDPKPGEISRWMPFRRPLDFAATPTNEMLVADNPIASTDLEFNIDYLLSPDLVWSGHFLLDLAVDTEDTQVTIDALGSTTALTLPAGRSQHRVALDETQIQTLAAIEIDLLSIETKSVAANISTQGGMLTAIGADTSLDLVHQRKGGVQIGLAAERSDTVPVRFDGLHINQGSQDIGGTLPAVNDRAGLLRLFAVNESRDAITNVSATATLSYPDGRFEILELDGPERLPAIYRQRDRELSYDVAIPPDHLEPHVHLQATLTFDHLGTTHTLTYPRARPVEMMTATLKPRHIIQIPIHDSWDDLMVLSTDIYDNSQYISGAYTWMPFPHVTTEIRDDLAATRDEVNEATGKTGAKALLTYAKQTELGQRGSTHVATIKSTGGGLATAPGAYFTASTQFNGFVHEFGHNVGMGHGQDYWNCPIRGSVAYNVLTLELEEEMYPGQRPSSTMGPCQFLESYRLDGGEITEERFKWGNLGNHVYILKNAAKYDEAYAGTRTVTPGDLNCTGEVDLADALVAARAASGEIQAAASCDSYGAGSYHMPACNGARPCTNIDAIRILENLINPD